MKKFLLLFLILSNVFAEGLIKIAIKGENNNINPIYNANNDIVKLLYLGLFYKNNNKDLIPALAKSYEISEDKLTYKIKLIENIYFLKNNVNYGELTSEDVKTTYEMLKNQLFNPINFNLYSNIKDIKIIDKYEVDFILNKPDNDFLNTLTIGILSKNALLKYGLNYFNNDAIGIGFYALKSNSHEQIAMVKNSQCPIKINNNGLVFNFFENYTQIKNAINNGYIDISFIDYKNIKNLNQQISTQTLNSNHAIALNLANINNNKLKKAISFIICNENIIELNPYFNQISYKLGSKNNICNRMEAKKILNELGYQKEKRSISLDINKEPSKTFFKKDDLILELDIYVNNLNKDHINVAKNISQQLNDFGINANIISYKNNDLIHKKKYMEINDVNISEDFLINTSDILNKYIDFNLPNKNHNDYILLANYNYYLAYNTSIQGLKETNVNINNNGYYIQAINWYK